MSSIDGSNAWGTDDADVDAGPAPAASSGDDDAAAGAWCLCRCWSWRVSSALDVMLAAAASLWRLLLCWWWCESVAVGELRRPPMDAPPLLPLLVAVEGRSGVAKAAESREGRRRCGGGDGGEGGLEEPIWLLPDGDVGLELALAWDAWPRSIAWNRWPACGCGLEPDDEACPRGDGRRGAELRCCRCWWW
jgi:hypothetical protein